MNKIMKQNGMRHFSPVIFFTVVILVTINIHVCEAKMTIAQVRNALKSGSKTCMTKTGATKEMVAKAREGEFPEDPALQCYFACLFKLMKVVSKDEQIDLNMIKNQCDLLMVPDLANPLKQLIEQCIGKLTSSGLCERSLELVHCCNDIDSSLYFFP